MENPFRLVSSVQPEMACYKPLGEKGANFTQTDNEVSVALIGAGLEVVQLECLLVIIRYTWGYRRPSAPISYDDFESMIHRNRHHIIDTLKVLEERRFILVDKAGKGRGKKNTYMINECYDTWIISAPDLTFPSSNSAVDNTLLSSNGAVDNTLLEGEKVCPTTPLMLGKGVVKGVPHHTLSAGKRCGGPSCEQLPKESSVKEEKSSSVKKEEKDNTTTTGFKHTTEFQEYAESIRPFFREFDFDNELRKFLAANEGKKLQNPKLNLDHWMEKAQEHHDKNKPGPTPGAGRVEWVGGSNRKKKEE